MWDGSIKGFSAYQHDIFSLLGIHNPHEFIDDFKIYAEVVFPDTGCCLGDFFESDYSSYISAYRPLPSSFSRNIYISRRNIDSMNGVVSADAHIEAIMRKNGFEIYYPELDSISEQLNVYSSCKIISGIESSAFHTPIFLSDEIKAKFVAIGRHRMGRGVFSHIKKAKNLNYHTINLHSDIGRSYKSSEPLSIDLSLLELIIERTNGFANDAELLNYSVDVGFSRIKKYSDALKNFDLNSPNLSFDSLRRFEFWSNAIQSEWDLINLKSVY